MRELKESELTSVAGGGSFFEAVEAGLNTASRSGSLSAGWAEFKRVLSCLLYTSPSPRDQRGSRMPSSA